MVFSGAPSKGCETCRKRKIRCDREEPTCGQCLYSKRECLGYRDPLALSFRDETDNVIQRWKTGAQKNPRVQRKTKTVSVFPEEDLETNAPDTLALISVSLFRSPAKSIHINNSSTRKSSFDSTFSMQPAVDELGVSFFVSNHIRVSPDALLQGGSPYLRSVCYDAKPDDALSLSMQAVGLANYSNTRNSSHLMREAQRIYVRALRKLNNALGCPISCIQDDTLVAIWTIGAYEIITGTSSTSIHTWRQHVNGSAALLILRGQSQLSTPSGLSLFSQISSQIVLCCLQSELPLPPKILSMRREVFSRPLTPVEASPQGIPYEAEHHGDTNPHAEMSTLQKELQVQLSPEEFHHQQMGNLYTTVDNYTVFRAAIRDGSITDLKLMISTLLEFDTELTRIVSAFPAGWSFETVYSKSMEMTYNGAFDIYHNPHIAMPWNYLRSVRILIHETIRTKILQGFNSQPSSFTDQKYITQLQKTIEIIGEMRDEILRSVPETLGIIPQILPGTGTSKHLDAEISGSAKAAQPPAWKGAMLLWPLWIATSVKISPPSIRQLAMQRLRYLSEHMGLRQADVLADFMVIVPNK